jgi:hypothetical protein
MTKLTLFVTDLKQGFNDNHDLMTGILGSCTDNVALLTSSGNNEDVGQAEDDRQNSEDV